MGDVNFATLLLAALAALWLCYVLPGVSRRRSVLGTVHEKQRERDSTTQRLLRSTADTEDGQAMTEDQPALSAASTRQRILASDEAYRATADAAAVERGDEHADRSRRSRDRAPRTGGSTAARLSASASIARAHRLGEEQRRRRTIALFVLAGATVLWALVAVFASAIPLWTALVPAVALAGFVVLLRRAELIRRERMRRVAALRSRVESEVGAMPFARRGSTASPETDAATERFEALLDGKGLADEHPHRADPAGSHVWTPVPVPTPAYLLKDSSPIAPTPISGSLSYGYEAEDVEQNEAADETEVRVDFDLDSVMEQRRRA